MHPQSVLQTSVISLHMLISRKPQNEWAWSVSVKCLQTPRFSSGKTLSSNHNTGNFLRHSINITANQRLSPTFQGNQNKGHDTDVSLPDFFWGEGGSVHRLLHTSSNLRVGSAFELFQVYCQMWRYLLINWCRKTLSICCFFFLKKQYKTKWLRKKEKSFTRLESNPRPLKCQGNALSIAPLNHF